METLTFAKPDDLQFTEIDHSYTIGGKKVPSVTEIIKDTGIFNLDFVAGDVLQVAAERGKRIHTACEAADLGMFNPEEADTEMVKNVEWWNEAKKLIFSRDKPEAMAVEEILYCPSNRYCGRADRIYKTDSWNYVIVDIKTGFVNSKYCGLQMAGYAIALRDITNVGTYRIRTIIVQLKDGFKLIPISWTEYENYFISAINLYNFKRR